MAKPIQLNENHASPASQAQARDARQGFFKRLLDARGEKRAKQAWERSRELGCKLIRAEDQKAEVERLSVKLFTEEKTIDRLAIVYALGVASTAHPERISLALQGATFDRNRLVREKAEQILVLSGLLPAKENKGKVGLLKAVREDVQAVKEKDPAAIGLGGLQIALLYPGIQAVALYRLAHALYENGLLFAPRAISTLARFLTGIEIHPAAKIGRRFFIDHGSSVVIGATTEIGDDVLVYHKVTFGTRNVRHNPPGKRHPTIGSSVVLGDGAGVFGPVFVEDEATIGAHAVVTRNVEKGETITGVNGNGKGKQVATNSGNGSASGVSKEVIADG